VIARAGRAGLEILVVSCHGGRCGL